MKLTSLPGPRLRLIAPLIAILLSLTVSLAQVSAAPANPLSVSILSPTQGSVLSVSGTLPPPGSGVLISASSSAGTITGVSLSINGASAIGGSLLSGSASTYVVPWDPFTAGFFTLIATATDSTGAVASSTPVTVTVESPGFAVNYVMNTQWPGGFNATITIKSGEYTTGWTLSFVFPATQQITQGWGGIFSQQGSQVTITNTSSDASFVPGGTITVGFNASWNANNPAPTSFTLNAIACTSNFSTLCALGTTLPPVP